MTFLDQIIFSASISGPICIMLLIGVFLRRVEAINENFIDVASSLVFKVSLPAMLFLSIIKSDTISPESINLVMYGVVANILFFLFAMFTTPLFVKNRADRGTVIQGAYRANTGIIGLAYIANLFGDAGVSIAAYYVAALTLLYNILVLFALSDKTDKSKIDQCKSILKSVVLNPLIISIILGLIVFKLSIPIPKMILSTGQYLANITLPLALLCTGGSLNLQQMALSKSANVVASSYRLILSPFFVTLGAYLFGFSGMQLAIIFCMAGAPAASASYVMARSMGGNPTLAANIIALTTIGGILTSSIGIFILTRFGFI